MMEPDFDGALGRLLTPPASAAPDRLFAARVDDAIGDLARLQTAERFYARGFLREVAALVAAALAGLLLARSAGFAAVPWLAALPLLMLMLVLLRGGRQPTGSSPAP
jgi:hypothetical protein